jgi:hypothetical protein
MFTINLWEEKVIFALGLQGGRKLPYSMEYGRRNKLNSFFYFLY